MSTERSEREKKRREINDEKEDNRTKLMMNIALDGVTACDALERSLASLKLKYGETDEFKSVEKNLTFHIKRARADYEIFYRFGSVEILQRAKKHQKDAWEIINSCEEKLENNQETPDDSPFEKD